MKLTMRLPAECEATGLPKSTVYAWAKAGRFPLPIRLGERASAWRADEIQRWIETRTRESRGGEEASGGNMSAQQHERPS